VAVTTGAGNEVTSDQVSEEGNAVVLIDVPEDEQETSDATNAGGVLSLNDHLIDMHSLMMDL
jgi:hypothetical protein